MKHFLLSLIFLLLTNGAALAGQIIEGMVCAVYDGDTILLATRGQNRFKVRLYGIDAPETPGPDSPGQPFGVITRRTLMFKIMGREVSAEVVESDQYQRAVAVIRYSGRDINREMVSEGMAWAYRRYLSGSYESEYIEAESMARASHRGLWRNPDPVPPWEFRHKLKKYPRSHRRWQRIKNP